LRRLVVVRESDASDRLLFEDLIYKTVEQFLRLAPELAVLIEAKLDPIDNPRAWGAALTKRRSGKSCLFVLGESLILYHLGSAKYVEHDEDLNFFTAVLLDAIERSNAPEILAGHVTRLVRDEINSKRIETLLLERQCTVRANGTVIDFTQPHASMVWTAMASAAAQERQAIVERNRLGRIAAARRNWWPHGQHGVPPGYRYEGKSLVVDPAECSRIRAALEVLADPHLSNRQLVTRLGALGVTRERIRKLHGEAATVADVMHPKDVRGSFLRYLSLYERGVYEMPLPNPSPGVKTFGGLPVHGMGANGPRDLGFVILTYQFGVPEGGWAPPEVFEAIRQRSVDDQAFRTGARDAVRPFGGRPAYDIGSRIFQIDTNSSKGYRLLEHKSDGTTSHRVTLATMEAHQFHKDVAHGLAACIGSTFGVEGELRASAIKYVEAPERRMERTIKFHRSRAARAREEVLRANDEITAAAFRLEAEREESLAQAALDHAQTPLEDTPAEVAIDPSVLLNALATIARCELSVPADTAHAIRELIPRLEVFPDPDNTRQLRANVWLQVPTTSEDVLELGPIELPLAHQTRRLSTTRLPEVKAEVLEHFSQGKSPLTIATDMDLISVDAIARYVQEGLQDAGLTQHHARRVRNTPIPELRRVVGQAAVHGHVSALTQVLDTPLAIERLATTLDLVPDGVDPHWAIVALQTYLAPLTGSPRTWSMPTLRGQQVIDLVESRGGTARYGDFSAIAHHFDTGSAIYRRFIGEQAEVKLLRALGPWLRAGRNGHDPDNQVELMRCPHCDSHMTCHLRILELPGAVLCRNCGRSTTSRAVFPESYMLLPRGFQHLNSEGGTEPGVHRIDNTPIARRPKLPLPSGPAADAIIADYCNPSIPIEGTKGILARHGITALVLYKLLEATGTPKRRPYRPRG
jgi:hypothetical protein